jgi:hypothetical protein
VHQKLQLLGAANVLGAGIGALEVQEELKRCNAR